MPFQIFQFYDIEKLAKCRSNLHRNRKKLVEFALEEKKIPEFPKKTKKKKLAEITSYQIHVLPYKNTGISGSYRFGYVFLISVRLTVASCNFAVFTTK
jgi:hypothetical protein